MFFLQVSSIHRLQSFIKGLVYCAAILADGIFFWSDIEAFPSQNGLCDVRVQAKNTLECVKAPPARKTHLIQAILQ